MRNSDSFHVTLVAAVLHHSGLMAAINNGQVATLKVSIIEDPAKRRVPQHSEAYKTHTSLVQMTSLTDFVRRFAAILQQQGAGVADVVNGRAKLTGWTLAAAKPQAARVTEPEQVGASA